MWVQSWALRTVRTQGTEKETVISPGRSYFPLGGGKGSDSKAGNTELPSLQVACSAACPKCEHQQSFWAHGAELLLWQIKQSFSPQTTCEPLLRGAFPWQLFCGGELLNTPRSSLSMYRGTRLGGRIQVGPGHLSKGQLCTQGPLVPFKHHLHPSVSLTCGVEPADGCPRQGSTEARWAIHPALGCMMMV